MMTRLIPFKMTEGVFEGHLPAIKRNQEEGKA